MSTTEETTLITCSFCGKTQKEVKKLIAGPNVYICDECIALCNTIIDVEGGEPARASTEQMVKVFADMLAKDVPARGLTQWAGICIQAGATWEQIGVALGMPAGDAEARFGAPTPTQ